MLTEILDPLAGINLLKERILAIEKVSERLVDSLIEQQKTLIQHGERLTRLETRYDTALEIANAQKQLPSP
ncbi:MAG: hypothetical protein ACR2RB_22915 [Gammaproteobacteria bacterium]